MIGLTARELALLVGLAALLIGCGVLAREARETAERVDELERKLRGLGE